MSTSVRASDVAEYKYDIVLSEVRAQLARRQWTQQDLVHRSGLSQSTVSRRLSGNTAFTLPELFDVCGVLGMSVTELLLAADANRPRTPGGAGTDPRPVAGARFELATSGLSEQLADVVRLPVTWADSGLTQDDFALRA